MTTAANEMVRLRDGRQLEVLLGGDPDGRPLVFHTGTPSAPVEDAAVTRAAADAGLRLVSWGRPGYARSTPSPGRSVADVVPDTVEVLDHLGATGDFVTMGHSGGGPHALACAALLPNRCRAAATVGGVTPWDAEGLDVLAGMGPENVEEFGLAVRGEAALTPFLEAARTATRDMTRDGVVAAFGGLVPPVDVEVLTGEVAEFFAASFRRAMEVSIAGWRDDDLAFVRPWGFELSDISVPVRIWQGEQDRMVPFTHGQWLAAHVPGAEAFLLPEHGHLSLTVAEMPAVLADLKAAADL